MYLHVVLPTPPFPPTKTHRSVIWSMIFWIDGSKTSASSTMLADAILMSVNKKKIGNWWRDRYQCELKAQNNDFNMADKMITWSDSKRLAKIKMCGICCCLFVDNHSSRSRYKVGFYPLSDLSIPSYFFLVRSKKTLSTCCSPSSD